MKLHPQDASFDDYVARRRAFVATLPAEPKERLRLFKEWTDANSPFSPSEKLANLKRALFEDDMEAITAKPLSPAAIEVLGQLYVNGPTWDGNICSKAGRGDLCAAGLAWHAHGYANLTQEGVRVAVEWDRAYLRERNYDRWLKKLRDS